MKSFRLSFLLLIISGFISKQALSQTSSFTIDSLKDDVTKINKIFDSSYFLQFKVQYIYSSNNLVTNKHDIKQKEGNYLVSGKRFYFDLGDLEYMQDETMAITAIHANKVMLISKNTMPTASSSIQLKSWVEQMINSFQQYYDISLSSNSDPTNGLLYARTAGRINNGVDSLIYSYDSTTTEFNILDSIDFVNDTRTVLFDQKDSTQIGDTIKLPYKKFSMSYSKTRHQLEQMEFFYKELDDEITQETIVREGIVLPENLETIIDTTYVPDSTTMTTNIVFTKHTVGMSDKKMTIVFSDYKYADPDPDFFKKERFVYFDRLNKKIITIDKYKDYILSLTGFDDQVFNDDNSPDVEGSINNRRLKKNQ